MNWHEAEWAASHGHCRAASVGHGGQNENRAAGAACMRFWHTMHGKMYPLGQARVPGPAGECSQDQEA
eukprot:6096374-Alexandrium_andersonii.AAC.1